MIHFSKIEIRLKINAGIGPKGVFDDESSGVQSR